MTSYSNSRHYFSCLGLLKLKKKPLIVIYFSLSGGIGQQISVFSFTFSLPWLLKRNSWSGSGGCVFLTLDLNPKSANAKKYNKKAS